MLRTMQTLQVTNFCLSFPDTLSFLLQIGSSLKKIETIVSMYKGMYPINGFVYIKSESIELLGEISL